MFSKKWPDGLEIRELTPAEEDSYIKPAHAKLFAQSASFRADSIYTQDETNKLDTLKTDFSKAIYRLQLGAFWNGEFCGWHFGRQLTADTYYMTNSATLPEFRRRKIYQRILEVSLLVLEGKGFQCIQSQHHPTNNAVIIPKLNQGFHIAGMEISDNFGTTVILKKYVNPRRTEVFEYRTGYTMPSDFIMSNVLKKK